ncbi:MAG: peptidase S41, partial [Deltaproteobacteria bacterium]|nr:peptidase S41 [Deltaproteobacteria bacterium]
MKKWLFMGIASVAVMLAAVIIVITNRAEVFQINSQINANLSAGASIEEGPIPTVASYDLSAHQILSHVILLIRENYVEPERIHPYEMFLAALEYIEKSVPEVLVDRSKAPEFVKISVGSVERVFDLSNMDQLWEVTMLLRDIFRFLQNQLPDPEQRQDVEYAAINGMLSRLDPHSILLKPESFAEVKTSTKGEFGGLGIVI